MNREEQIAEMEKIIKAEYEQWLDTTGVIPKASTYYAECLGCAIDSAETLYNIGYRKVLLDTEDGKTVDCVQYAPWQLIEGYTEREVEKARKDTAKAILNVLYFNLQSSVKGHIAKSNVYYNVMGRIQEIAKNYGVEIEE